MATRSRALELSLRMNRPLVALFGLWAAFCGWCIWRFPPAVDLPAHGAQVETLLNLLRGDQAVLEIYRVTFPLGYGLTFWLGLPFAAIFNGATAVRIILWATLILFAVSHLFLLRTYQRSDWGVLLGLPLAFNISYWYGYLPGLFALPFLFFSLASFERSLRGEGTKWLLLTNVFALITLLSHLLVFVVLAILLGVRCLWSENRWKSIGQAVVALAFPLLLSIPKAWSMATRAVVPGNYPPTEYDLASHFNWFFRAYRAEGRLNVIGPLICAAIFLVVYLAKKRKEPALGALFFAAALIYFITPKTLSGINQISVRLPVIAGMLSLVLIDFRELPRAAQFVLPLLSLACLIQIGTFHWEFARQIEGLNEVIAKDPHPGRHGYLSIAGETILGSRLIYLEHLGQWLTATNGGVGHNFFADAEHHPVRFRGPYEPTASLNNASDRDFAWFDQVLLFGEGEIPARFRSWRVTTQVARWQLLVQP